MVTVGPTHSSKWRCSSGDHSFISHRSPEGSGDPPESHSYHLRDAERTHLWLTKAQRGVVIAPRVLPSPFHGQLYTLSC